MPLHLVHSTFIRYIDVVSYHPACLLTLHCALSRGVVMGMLQVPLSRLWYCVKWHKLLCTSIVPSQPAHLGPQQCIGAWLGCTPNPNLWTPLTLAFFVMAHLT